MPSLSIVIPAYNEEKYIGACLESIIKHGGSAITEIIVADNASTDKTTDVARRYPGVTVVTETKRGANAARQRGYEASRGEMVAFLDADIRMWEGWSVMVMQEFEKNPKLSCLSGPWIYYDMSRWQRALVWLYFRLLAIPTYWITGHLAIAGNVVLRRSVLEKMNGLDASIVFYGDDTNTARRASEFGKMKFSLKLVMYTSARRLSQDGLFKSAGAYIASFLSETILHKPHSAKYENFR